jgi:cytoskeletal protein CcmA (bactofilin family)
VLQKDGFFRKTRDGERSNNDKRDDNFFRSATTPVTPSATPAANAAPVSEAVLGASAAGERKEAKLVVGPDIKLKGVEISDCDTLIVEGRVEATLDSRVLEITPNGVFQGTIAVDNAEVHGRFEGELTVRKQLTIFGAGKVSGKIRYAKIKVEEGAELSGEISMLDKSQSSVRKAA